MFIIAPLSNCASSAKRDRFLEYISKIAPVTYKGEPKCHAYAWFRSAEDNEAVPHHWVRGLEIYEDIESNTITHRASAEYKAFRAAVGTEQLLERPSDLRFWRPSSVGFLRRDGGNKGPETFFGQNQNLESRPSETHQYIVIDELTPSPGYKDSVIKQLQELVRKAEHNENVLSFWVLHRGDGNQDDDLLVFARYVNKEKVKVFEDGNQAASVWKEVYGLTSAQRRTTWVESGLGFIGR